MQMPQLQISQQHARLGLESKFGQISMRQQQADMQISQTPSNIRMSTEHAMIQIDQRQAFDEAGLKHVFTLITEDAQKGNRAALQATARIARDGDRLRDVHIPSDPIVEFAMRGRGQMPITGIKFIPSYGAVKMSYQPTETTMQVQPHNVSINVNINKPEIQFNPGQANAYIAQKNSIYMNVVGGAFNQGL